ncbi:hypothetical protein F993_01496 [Acinetobacter proteolyticus]|uniref:Uncharacterized protein n=1 Tax=Acinetobacter proteolyticus TaxID=1776741 RepID=A0A2N0WEX1_9GAMM|nr:DUF6714 family protein [Acinetobacter proteolyticus]ENU24180.1 hypothetical protein F993_01496 [Acinetobacter proteolyticus]PKF33429.1 hypothetical protein CW311_11550 [Acinetobacter proteolyticus]
MNETLEKIFPLYDLGDSYSLLECDFYDTHYRYFEEIDDNYLTALNMSAKDLILKYNFQWPEFYTNAALKAVSTRSRSQEGIKTWEDVSYEYLYYFGDSCNFLDSKGFKFFLPAAINHFLTTNKNKAFMDSFVFRLETRWDEDNHVFSDDQKQFIKEFLRENT